MRNYSTEVTAVIESAERLTDHWAAPISELVSLADIQTHMTVTAQLMAQMANALAAFHAAEEQEEGKHGTHD